MDERVKVFFDKEHRIRVFDPEKFSRAEELEKEASTFLESNRFPNHTHLQLIAHLFFCFRDKLIQ